MREILRETGWSQREWARRAGISETHPRLILQRLEADPDKPTVEVWAIVQLADAAGVRLDWLLRGVGPKRADVDVEQDPLYPSRAAAIAACYALGLPEATIARIRAISGLPADPGERFWIDQAFAARQGAPLGPERLLPPRTTESPNDDPQPNRPKRRSQ